LVEARCTAEAPHARASEEMNEIQVIEWTCERPQRLRSAISNCRMSIRRCELRSLRKEPANRAGVDLISTELQ